MLVTMHAADQKQNALAWSCLKTAVWVLIVLIIGALCCLSLIRMSRNHFYFQPLANPHPYYNYLIAADQEYFVDSRIHTYATKPWSQITSRDIIMLYMHGRYANLLPYLHHLQEMGTKLSAHLQLSAGESHEAQPVTAIIFDYSSFGKTKGVASHSQVMKDALLVARWTRKHWPTNTLIYYGESLGSSVAAHTAQFIKPDALVLKSPFASMKSLALDSFPIIPEWMAEWIIGSEFDTQSWLEKYDGPKLLIFNSNDTVVPYKNTSRLSPTIPRIMLEGSHSDNPLNSTWLTAMQDIIARAKSRAKQKE